MGNKWCNVKEGGREGEMWPEYGLINYGVQTAAAALERAREDASFADDGKEYEFLARHTDDDAGWGYVSLEGWKLGILHYRRLNLGTLKAVFMVT